jgi:DNA-binding transcriptional LysR family regulator
MSTSHETFGLPVLEPDLVELDLRRLKYFVCVAENLSFVQAAEQLHLTQPALSRQVQALELELGVKLFDRDRRGTALTEPGRQLLDDAKQLLAESAGLVRRVRAAARAETEFVIGFMPGVPSTAIVREFTAATGSQLIVDVVYVPMDEQESFLIDGRVDVCFVRLPLSSGVLRAIPLFEEPRVAVLAVASPLADAVTLRLNDLIAVPLIDSPLSVPEWRGDSLPRRRPLTNVEERLEAVASGAGFSVLPAGIAAYYRRDDVKAVPLEDIPPITVAIAYTRHRTMPEIEIFAGLARRRLQSAPDPQTSANRIAGGATTNGPVRS